MRSIRSNEIIGNFEEKGGKFDAIQEFQSRVFFGYISSVRSLIDSFNDTWKDADEI